MNNKKINRHLAAAETELDIVYGQMHKNKEEIELFYAKNKMKFPPILQSKNIVFMHLLPEYVEISINAHQGRKNSKEQPQQHELIKMGSRSSMEKQASICNIEFQKSSHRKIRAVNHRRTGSNHFTPNNFKTLTHTRKKYYLPEERSLDLKFLSEPTTENKNIQDFFEKLTKGRNNEKKSTFILAKSYQIGKQAKSKDGQPLSINKIPTENPEATQTSPFPIKKMSLQTQRRGHIPRLPNNGGYEKGQGGNIFPRQQASYRKQGGFLEPWQQQTMQEDDYFGEFRR